MDKYEVFMYVDGELSLHIKNNDRERTILDYQKVVYSARGIMKNMDYITSQVYLKRNGYTIAEIHFHKDFTGHVTYGKRYKNDFLSCDPLRKVVKQWKQ